MSEQNDLNAMLRLPDKGVSETKGVGGMIARLWRTIIWNEGIEIGRMEHYLSRYIERARKNTMDPSIAGYFNKGNLRRAMARDKMTWKVFVKMLRIIDITHIKLAVELTHRGGKISRHGIDIDIGNDEDVETERTTWEEE